MILRRPNANAVQAQHPTWSSCTSSSIRTVTVGPGVSPGQPQNQGSAGRGLYRQWGISPRPEDMVFTCLCPLLQHSAAKKQAVFLSSLPNTIGCRIYSPCYLAFSYYAKATIIRPSAGNQSPQKTALSSELTEERAVFCVFYIFNAFFLSMFYNISRFKWKQSPFIDILLQVFPGVFRLFLTFYTMIHFYDKKISLGQNAQGNLFIIRFGYKSLHSGRCWWDRGGR